MTEKKQNKRPTHLASLLILTVLVAGSLATAQDGQAAAQTNGDTAQPGVKKNPRRPDTYSDALANVGNDGIIVFCYGPDWNRRSVRMLKKFWENSNIEKVTGDAMLVAAPLYQNPTPEQKDQALTITQGMPAIPFGICPTVMMIDSSGRMYANLPGTDNLGDENGSLAIKNIQEKLEVYRKQKKLMAEAETLSGQQKALKLGEIADLPIQQPSDLINLIRNADPEDKTGMVRRNEHSSLQFLYKMMHTKDGFLSNDFQPTMEGMLEESMKVINDTTLRPIDRQAAYCLLIGQARREEGGGKHMKDLINACVKLDPNSVYGKICLALATMWNGAHPSISPEQLKPSKGDSHNKNDNKKGRKRN